MIEMIAANLIDLSIVAGIVLFFMSFLRKYKKHRAKMITASIVLFALGIAFIDIDALHEAYQKGREFAGNWYQPSN